jgi:hypothetical protein
MKEHYVKRDIRRDIYEEFIRWCRAMIADPREGLQIESHNFKRKHKK